MTRLVNLVRKIPGVHHLARRWVNRYAEGSITRIRFGPARGLRWVRSHAYVNEYWLGTFEPLMQAALVRHVRQDMTFFDLGSNAGFYSLLARHLAGPQGSCVSVDPDPFNIDHVRQVRAVNHLDRWEIVHAALAAADGEATFQRRSPGDSGGHIAQLTAFSGDNRHASETLTVPTYSLDAITRRLGPVHVLKMDIEGAEYETLCQGETALTLGQQRPVLILELHGHERAQAVQRLLQTYQYRLTTLTGNQPDFTVNNIFQVVAEPD
jgi:FkbM family methyltransferase